MRTGTLEQVRETTYTERGRDSRGSERQNGLGETTEALKTEHRDKDSWSMTTRLTYTGDTEN